MRAARAYVAGDRITCLICSKPFRAVCHHARLAHGISARDYKLRFGLPVSKSVATPEACAAWSAAISKTRAEGRIVDGTPPGGHHRQPAYAARDMRRIDPEQIDRVLYQVHKGCTLTEACSKPGAPRWTWLHAQIKRDDALRARFDAAIELLPFAQQARMKKLRARFAEAVAARRGGTAAAISRALGVSEEAVRRQMAKGSTR